MCPATIAAPAVKRQKRRNKRDPAQKTLRSSSASSDRANRTRRFGLRALSQKNEEYRDHLGEDEKHEPWARAK